MHVSLADDLDGLARNSQEQVRDMDPSNVTPQPAASVAMDQHRRRLLVANHLVR